MKPANQNADLGESLQNRTPEATTCPLCGHAFPVGGLKGNLYCPKCGRRFNPRSALDETVAVPGPGKGRGRRQSEKSEETEPSGQRFGNYDILSEVARGGMGLVYRARQRTLKRIVALKVLRGGDGATDEELERFMREAKAAASLSHPNIVPIHELSVWQGKHFFTMDYIEGTPLDRRIEQNPMTPFRAFEILETIARTVQYAHSRGIIHRDLKPANIILDTEERPMITDFGLAVNLTSDVRSQRMTRTGSVMGTIPYIPPEQASGKVEDVDETSDVYSLGAVLYEMLTGEPPFQGETQYDLLRRVIDQDPLPPRHINPRIHPDAETICLKCLQKDRNRRYTSALDLAKDCRRFLQGQVIQARPATVGYRLLRYASRYRTQVIMGTALVGIALVALLILVRGERQTERMQHNIKQQEKKEQSLIREKKEQEDELARGWRREILLKFDRNTSFANSPEEGQRTRLLWADRKHVKLDKNKAFLQIQGLPEKQTGTALAGLPMPFPLDFDLTVRVQTPPKGAGSLTVLINTDRTYRRHEATQTLHLGIPGRPGARLVKGAATLAEKPTFVMAPEIWQRLRIRRFEGILSVYLSGDLLFTMDQPAGQADQKNTYLALSATGGMLRVKSLSVAVRGLSRAMIESLLEVASSLTLHRDHRLALKLYERVAMEKSTSLPDHLAALRGIARSLALAHGNNPRALQKECDRIMEQVQTSQRLAKGEHQYLYALALTETNRPNEWRQAIEVFRKAAKNATPKADKLIRFGPCKLIGPFDAPTGEDQERPPPEEEYEATEIYAGKNGVQIGWQTVGRPDTQGELLNFPNSTDHAAFYVRRVYTCARELPVTVYTGSDDSMVLWINGRLALARDVERALAPDSDQHQTVFRAGENVVLMRVTNGQGPAGFFLRVAPRTREVMGMYGLLASLEEAILHLRIGNAKTAHERLASMGQDRILTTLANDYAEALRVGTNLTHTLEETDKLLQKKAPLDALLGVLEAMSTLYADAGEDLALRYHRLAGIYMQRKAYAEADAMLLRAAELSPTWYLPRFDRAMLYFQQGQDSAGRAELAEAQRGLIDNLELHLAIARFYLQEVQGRPRDALLAHRASAQAVLISEQLNPEAHRLKARALDRLGRIREATAAMDKAIEVQEKPSEEDRAFHERLQTRLRDIEKEAPARSAPEQDPPEREEE